MGWNQVDDAGMAELELSETGGGETGGGPLEGNSILVGEVYTRPSCTKTLS